MKYLLYIGNNLQQKTSNPSYMGTLGPLLEYEGYKMYYASDKRHKLFRLFDMLYKVIYYSNKVDFVLIDTYSTQNFYYALLVSQLCRLLRIDYIPILHGGNLPERLKSNPKMSALIFRNSIVNITPSTYLKNCFESFDYFNLKYIPNIIEISNYHFLQRNYNAPKLLWVRSFSKLYNPFLAITVLKAIRDLGYDASLCMVGPDSDGTLREVKDLAKELGVNVEFTGKLSKQEWIKLSEDYNVFINTTNVDNTPVSVIEAMSLGLPIVSTNVGGMPYLIKHGTHGLLVEKENVNDMTNAILSLFQDSEKREQMILNARKLSETFDWNLVKIEWNEILQN